MLYLKSKGKEKVMIKIVKECLGYRYTSAADADGQGHWAVKVDYLNNRLYINPPTDKAESKEELEQFLLFASAIDKAVADIEHNRENREEV